MSTSVEDLTKQLKDAYLANHLDEMDKVARELAKDHPQAFSDSTVFTRLVLRTLIHQTKDDSLKSLLIAQYNKVIEKQGGQAPAGATYDNLTELAENPAISKQDLFDYVVLPDAGLNHRGEQSPFYWAAYLGLADELERELPCKGSAGRDELLVKSYSAACQKANTVVVCHLLHIVQPTLEQSIRDTVLTVVCSLRRPDRTHQQLADLAKVLIKSGGASVNHFAFGVTPLMMACSTGNEVLVKVLLEHGADPKLLSNALENRRPNKNREPAQHDLQLMAVHFAARRWNLKLAKELRKVSGEIRPHSINNQLLLGACEKLRDATTDVKYWEYVNRLKTYISMLLKHGVDETAIAEAREIVNGIQNIPEIAALLAPTQEQSVIRTHDSLPSPREIVKNPDLLYSETTKPQQKQRESAYATIDACIKRLERSRWNPFLRAPAEKITILRDLKTHLTTPNSTGTLADRITAWENTKTTKNPSKTNIEILREKRNRFIGTFLYRAKSAPSTATETMLTELKRVEMR